MIFILSGLLIFLGLVQLLLWQRQRRRMSRLQIADVQDSRQILNRKINRYPLGRHIRNAGKDIRAHLVGSERSVFMTHSIVVVLIQLAAAYINSNYLNFNIIIIFPMVFIITLYALYLRSKKKMRQEFEASFSEAISIVTSSLRGGNSVMQGIEHCGEKLGGLLGKEFRQVAQRLEIGEEPQQVFMDSWERLPYREYYFFIVTVLVNMKGGGQIKLVMERLGVLIADSKIMERKKYAMTSEARMSVKILAIIPVIFFLFLQYTSPDSVDILLHHSTGQLIFYYAIGSILFGLLIVWMMMNKI